jgi:cystathionine beta-lyase/cystathionine gamma-synthase
MPRPGEPVVPPLVLSSTFAGGRGEAELRYTRYGNNPTQEGVARKLAELEGTEAALVLSSGMAAVAMTALALVETGGHIVASRHLYGATRTLFVEELPRRGIGCTLVDPDEPGAWVSAVRRETGLLYLEMPTNPTLRLPDPRPVVALGRERGIPVAMDATFATPVNARPAELGVDVVIHSATKYLGGHSDLIAGVVAGRAAVVRAVTAVMRLYGPSVDPHTAWLLDRGLRTLPMRMAAHNANALALARHLEGRPGVARVLHPGLASHPDHARSAALMPGGRGGMLSFVLAGGGPAADRFMEALEIIRVAPSLGGVESLASQPRHTSHRGMDAGARDEAGIPDGFIRISVGVEDAADLIADLDRGLAAARGPTGASADPEAERAERSAERADPGAGG